MTKTPLTDLAHARIDPTTTAAIPGTPAVAAQDAIPGTVGTSNTPAGNANPAPVPIPFDPLTLESQNSLLDFARGPGATGVADAQAGLNYGLNDARDPFNNPALSNILDTVNRRLSQQFTDPGGPLSQIRDQQLQAGQYGGTRQGIGEGIATARFGEILGDTTAQIVNNAYNTGQDTFIKSLGLAPQTLQLGALPATQIGAVGAQNENQAAALENYDASGRYFDLNSPFTALQNYANIVNGTVSPGQLSTGTPGVGGGSSGGIGGILSGGLGGASTGAAVSGGNPYAVAIGAGVGILGSIFS